MIGLKEQGIGLESDLVDAVRVILRSSPEPLPLTRIRAALPRASRLLPLDTMARALERQVAAQVLFPYPKYRSPHDRYWDRPMRVHLGQLLRGVLARGPLAWSELRRRLPDYAKTQAEPILQEELARGRLFAHPPLGPRLGPRYGLSPARPGPYVRQELDGLLRRMETLGFSPEQVRQALLEQLRSDNDRLAPTRPEGPPTQAADETLVEGGGPGPDSRYHVLTTSV